MHFCLSSYQPHQPNLLTFTVEEWESHETWRVRKWWRLTLYDQHWPVGFLFWSGVSQLPRAAALVQENVGFVPGRHQQKLLQDWCFQALFEARSYKSAGRGVPPRVPRFFRGVWHQCCQITWLLTSATLRVRSLMGTLLHPTNCSLQTGCSPCIFLRAWIRLAAAPLNTPPTLF